MGYQIMIWETSFNLMSLHSLLKQISFIDYSQGSYTFSDMFL